MSSCSDGAKNKALSAFRKAFDDGARARELRELEQAIELTELDVDFGLEGKPGVVLRIWQFCVAIAALLDFAAVTVDQVYYKVESPKHGQNKQPQPFSDHHADLHPWLVWLHDHATALGLIFSLVWFIDSFVVAHRERMRACNRREREELLETPEGESERIDQVKKEKPGWYGAWGVYFAAVAIQLLLLPVGFYTLVFDYLSSSSSFGLMSGNHTIPETHHRAASSGDYSSFKAYESFTAEANLCLGFALFKYIVVTVSNRTYDIARKRATAGVLSFARTKIFGAFRNPLKFQRWLRKTLRAIRWVIYLQPVGGPCAKLIGNYFGLIKMKWQHRRAEAAKKVRMRFRNSLPVIDLRTYCATTIQARYRAYRAQKYRCALAFMKGGEEQIAALRLQKRFREWLLRARSRLAHKYAELKAIEAKAKKRQLSASDRKRNYQLRLEIRADATRMLNESLLLRPDTGLVIAWQSVLVVAVLVEIVSLLVNPILSKHKDVKTGLRFNTNSYIQKQLVPVPVTELKECGIIPEPTTRMQALQKLLKRSPEFPENSGLWGSPWYCSPWYAMIQKNYITGLRFFLHHFHSVVGIVLYLEVFVHFFTGEIDPANGTLVPQPFFMRWFIPGLFLELAVNPHMETTSRFLFTIISHVFRQDPIRVLRWTDAFFYPATLLLFSVLRFTWLRVVAEQNSAANTGRKHWSRTNLRTAGKLPIRPASCA